MQLDSNFLRYLSAFLILLSTIVGCDQKRRGPTSNGKVSGMERYQYQCWEGGPHLVLPNAVANEWGGVFRGSDPNHRGSDYDRACLINKPFGYVKVGKSEGVVLVDPPMVAWDPSPSHPDVQIFFVLQAWDSKSLDDLLDRAKQEAEFKETDTRWVIPEGGVQMIYAGADSASAGSMAGLIDIPMTAGEYALSLGGYKKSGEGEVTVLRFTKQTPVADQPEDKVKPTSR